MVNRFAVLSSIGLLGAALIVAAPPDPASQSNPAGIEFFEKQVRPILADNCYQCHGREKQKANLRLDSAAGIQKGGDRGPAVKPGKPDASPLIRGINYSDEDFQMPPKGKLKEQQIADLTAWVQMGAPMPQGDAAAGILQPSEGTNGLNLKERLQHWCYQPVRQHLPPRVQRIDWPTSPIDAFVLARLEAEELAPAPAADKRTWLRRVTYDLIGLPLTAAEIHAFLADESPNAFVRVVDRLLASPGYGERWGRHWLDLVRFAETMGHEYDFDIFNSWRYRDYVIRAFNSDVPYNQFVLEHLAGDLLSEPRRHPTEGFNESIIGTGFFWFGEGKQAPVDVRQEQADRMDNQIDVFGKAFLAQTLSCARCHDHKFDAIPTQDYYALAGYLRSSRFQQAPIDPPERIAAKAARLSELKPALRTAFARVLAEEAEKLGSYLLAARKTAVRETAAVARDMGLDATLLERWAGVLRSEAAKSWQHPLYLWSQLPEGDNPLEKWIEEPSRKIRNAEQSARTAMANGRVFEAFTEPTFFGWAVTGQAFGDGPSRAGDLAFAPAGKVRFTSGGWAHSGLLSASLEGTLRSRTFPIENNYLHFLAAGKDCHINVIIDGFTLIRDPIYGGLRVELNDEKPQWRTINVGMWQGHHAYIEIVDSTTPDATTNPSADFLAGRAGNGYVRLKEIRFSNHAAVQPMPHPLSALLATAMLHSPVDLARRYQSLVTHHLAKWAGGDLARSAEGDAVADFVNWLLDEGLLTGAPQADLLAAYRQVESGIPPPTCVPAMADGTGEDEYVFLRGNYKTPGPAVLRHPPTVVGVPGSVSAEPTAAAKTAIGAGLYEGSGRLELARRIVNPSNPLLARVLVNRIWQHHFGAGLVRTPDDFGRMGEAPSHPELLDYLASEFMRSGWSIKHLHRLMLCSSTYRMSSRGDPHAEAVDPQNRWWHRMPIQRLDAEVIRDGMLAISGRLNQRQYGPSVLPYLTPFMEGRGRPATGPLDGDGRRSIYLGVRRNFLTPLFLAFDYPTPFTTMGRRTISNVPAQALTLMNDPLVLQQARAWAERVLADGELTPPQRIAKLYEAAFARPPSTRELGDALAFVNLQDRQYGTGPASQAWVDLCHVLFNVKEFIFVP